jgi:hypothetical protein
VPVKVEFINNIFVLSEAILGEVFEKNIFNPTKIMQGIFLDHSLAQKCFKKGNFGRT